MVKNNNNKKEEVKTGHKKKTKEKSKWVNGKLKSKE